MIHRGTPARLLTAALLATLATASSAASLFSGLFVFGDSLSDAGNLAIAIGADPAQVITGNSYIPGRPYASGQFTDGDVWAKTFAGALGLAAFGQPALAGGGNFAFGGARVATDGAGLPPSLKSQQDSFLAGTGGFAPPGALYVIEGGGNDARDALAAAASSLDPFGVIAAAAATYATQTGMLVDRLQDGGARHIVVWDVPNLGLAPAVAAQGPIAVQLGSFLAQSMNAALAARLALESGVTVFDIFGLQNRFVADPAAFGLSNVSDACGAVANCNPSTYLSWDGIHPTSAGHALLAREMLVVVAVPEPAEYALMMGGLMLITWRARRRKEGARGRLTGSAPRAAAGRPAAPAN
jgi:outer membrane lipase/esterase